MNGNNIGIPKFLTPRQIAQRWCWHTESVRRMIRRREILSIVIGRRRLVPVVEIERIEADGTVNARRLVINQ